MKVITLDDIEWIESPNYYEGRTARVDAITIHWWDNPAKNPTIEGVIRTFQNPLTEVSAHFIVSGDRVIQMVNMGDTAWHCRQGNPTTIGIEIDPNVPGNTYETVGALVRFIRGYYGNISLRPHSFYVATACPGTISLSKIDDYAYGRVISPTPIPVPPTPVTVKSYYKVIKDGKQIGAYTVEINAYNAYKSQTADKITLEGNDITQSLLDKYEPKPVISEKDTEQDSKLGNLNSRLSAMETLVNYITEFLRSLFSGFKK